MGRVLAEVFPVFAGAVDEVCGLLDRLLGRPVREAVFAAPGSAAAGAVDQTVFTQAGLFAVEVGLARLLTSWGVTPDYVTGHSVGEIAAAHVAGMFSLEDACKLVAARGRLMQELGGGGAMAAIAASEEELTGWLARAGISDAVVAAVNGPSSVVVSGAAGSVAVAGRYWRGRGRRVRRLRTSHAFHSPLVEPMLGQLGEVAAGLSYAAPRIPVVCSVTGELDAGLMGAAGYWVRQAREAVRFADCVRWLGEAGAGVFAELGGDGSLSALGQAIPAAAGAAGAAGAEGAAVAAGAVWVPVLRVRRAEAEAVLSAAAELFVRGVQVDWAAMFAGSGAQRVDLPTYAFQRQRYWPAAPAAESGGLPVAGGDGAEARSGPQLPEQSWRYAVTWQPVTGLQGDAMLAGRWLVLVPAVQAGAGLTADCVQALTEGGADVVPVTVDRASLDRAALADQLTSAAAAAGSGVAGVVSLLALDEGEHPGYPGVAAGVAGWRGPCC